MSGIQARRQKLVTLVHKVCQKRSTAAQAGSRETLLPDTRLPFVTGQGRATIGSGKVSGTDRVLTRSSTGHVREHGSCQQSLFPPQILISAAQKFPLIASISIIPKGSPNRTCVMQCSATKASMTFGLAR